jgi:hypothetical protein
MEQVLKLELGLDRGLNLALVLVLGQVLRLRLEF